MNLEEAEKIIFTAVGLYTSQRVPPKKRREKFENPLPQVLRTAAEVKVRPSFRVPEELEANAARLTALDAKFSQPYKVSEKTKGFLPQEEKITERAAYKGVRQEEKNDFDALLKIRKPEIFIERVFELFGGGNIAGKLSDALSRRVQKLPTREAEEQARKASELAKRRRQEEQAVRIAQAKAKEKADKFFNAYVSFVVLSVVFAVIAVTVSFAQTPIVFGERSGNAVIFMFCLAGAFFVAASFCAVSARKGKRKTVLNGLSFVTLALVIFAIATFYPAYTYGKKAVWLGVFIPLGVIWCVIKSEIARRKGHKDKTQFIEFILYAVCAFTCVAFAINTFSAAGFDGHYGIYYYKELPDGTLSVTLSTCYESVVVPESIKGKTVSEFDFSPRTANEKKLKELVLPKTLLRVSSPDIFSYCKNLEALSAHASVIEYTGVGKLKELTIYGNTVPKALCKQAYELRRVAIPDAETVEAQAFLSCSGLEKIEATTRLRVIEELAFANCASLQSIKLPESAQVGKAAFMRCTELKSVTVPNSVELETNVFAECSAIEYASLSAEHISQIPKDSLKTVEITGGAEIPERAFYTCRTLSAVSVAESVTAIGERAFQGCRSLQNVLLPDTVSTLGKYSFAGCSALESFDVPESVTELPGWLFEWNGNLKTVEIPGGLTRVGDAAFWGCESLQMSGLHNNVTQIGHGAFAHCKALTSFSLPLFITEIDELTFAYCNNLKSVWMCANIKRVEGKAFLGCDSFNKVTFSGTESEWNEIIMGTENEAFASAQVVFLK